MEIFKKLLFITILFVGTIIFMSCDKNNEDILKEKLIEKENKDLETKNLSIYELIKTSIQSNDELPETFKLPSKENDGLPWADGAMDGVFIYHTVRNEEDIEPLKNIVFQISEGKFKEAQNNLDNLEFSMVSRRNSLLNWIIQEKEQINANNLYQFASSQLTTSKNIEVIKFCLSVLAIMDVERDTNTIEKVKTLALSDEFTLYCLDIIVKLENSNDEIFKIAKKVKGWGRIHSIEYLQATNDEIKEWILEEGCHNGVLPAYTALTCAEKINLLEILNDEKISNKEFNSITYLITALFDEGAIMGISALKSKENILNKYLEKAKYFSSTEDDYRVVKMIKEYIKDNREINNKFIEVCDEILNSEKTKNGLKELMKNGNGYDIAKYLGIDTDEYVLEYLQNNLLKNPYIIYYISKKENMEKLVLFIEKQLLLEKMKGLPTNKFRFNQRNENDKEAIVLDTVVRNLENFQGIGENLIICALNSPYVDIRYGAVNTLESWKEKGYVLSKETIENVKNLKKIEVNDELRIKLNKLVK